MSTRSNWTFYVYILAGKSGVLYTGISNDLARRVSEHKEKKTPGFTQKYDVTKLVGSNYTGPPKARLPERSK
jgi:putative endonuclease